MLQYAELSDLPTADNNNYVEETGIHYLNVHNGMLKQKLNQESDLFQNHLDIYVKKYNLTELKSHYLGRSTYYFDKQTGYIWEFKARENMFVKTAPEFNKPPYEVFDTLANLNGLTDLAKYDGQAATL